MRLAIAAVVVSLGGAVAQADPAQLATDGAPPPPKKAGDGSGLAVGMLSQFEHVHGAMASGMGVMGEAHVVDGPWAVFGELGGGGLFVAPEQGPRGAFLRMGLGARRELHRWGDSEFATSVYLEGVAGGTRFWWDDGRALHPEVDVGAGYQMYAHGKRPTNIRMGVRLLVSHDDAEPTIEFSPAELAVSRATHSIQRTPQAWIDPGFIGTVQVWW